MKTYDVAFVPCREPDVATGEFPAHHNRTLETALGLLESGIVRTIVLSGRYATWYDSHNVTPWFGTEAEASAKYLARLGCPPGAILKDTRSQDSISNYMYSAEDIFIPKGMGRILVLAGDVRIPRLESLGKKVLDGVVNLDFASSGSANDPWLTQKEPFTLRIQDKYLADVPSGREGWPILKSWFYTNGLYAFWTSFDAAQQTMVAKGIDLNIPDIVASMDPTGLPPDTMEFAAITAGSLALTGR